MFSKDKMYFAHEELHNCKVTISQPEEFEFIIISIPEQSNCHINYLIYDNILVITGNRGDGLFKFSHRITLVEVERYSMEELFEHILVGNLDCTTEFDGSCCVKYLKEYINRTKVCEYDKSLISTNLIPLLRQSVTRKDAEEVWDRFFSFPLLQSYSLEDEKLKDSVMGSGVSYSHNAYLWYCGLKLAFEWKGKGRV